MNEKSRRIQTYRNGQWEDRACCAKTGITKIKHITNIKHYEQQSITNNRALPRLKHMTNIKQYEQQSITNNRPLPRLMNMANIKHYEQRSITNNRPLPTTKETRQDRTKQSKRGRPKSGEALSLFAPPPLPPTN